MTDTIQIGDLNLLLDQDASTLCSPTEKLREYSNKVWRSC